MAAKVDFLLNLNQRQCHHIVNQILIHLGIVVLCNARRVSTTWQTIIDEFVREKLPMKDRECLSLFSRFIKQNNQRYKASKS